MKPPFKYRKAGRSFGVWLMLACALTCVFVIEANGEAPLWGRAIFWALLAFVLWVLVWNPIRGIELSDTTLTIAPDGKARQIQLVDIDHLSITEGVQNLRFRLHIKDLKVLEVSPAHFPNMRKTITEFEARGIVVRAKRGLGF